MEDLESSRPDASLENKDGKEHDKPKIPSTHATDATSTNTKGVRWSSDVKDHHPKEQKKQHSDTVSTPIDIDAATGVARLPSLDTPDVPPDSAATTSGRVMLEDDWELTWPIWHLLPLHERREIAHRHGYNTIGAFEEYMSLQQALDKDIHVPSAASKPYSSNNVPPDKRKQEAQQLGGLQNKQQQEEEEEDSDLEEDDEGNATSTEEEDNNNNSEDDDDNDSLLLTFPDEILHKIFSFLPVTLYGTKLAYVSRHHAHWRRVTGSEAVMKQLCERVYLQQSKKKQLRIAKFHHSYRYMLYARPRVQAGGGVYILRFGRVKPIQRDMWTSVRPGAILETVYYRYLYFEEQGHCLYALTTIPPHDMLRRFHRVLLQSSRDNTNNTGTVEFAASSTSSTTTKKNKPRKLTAKEKERRAAEMDTRVVWGTYTIQKDRITVTAKQSWQTVQFGLRIVAHHNRPYAEHTYLHHNHHSNNNKKATPPQSTTTSVEKKKKTPAASAKTTGENGNEEDEVHEYVNATHIPPVSPHGRFGVLQLEQHRSSISGNFDDHDSFLDGQHHPRVFHHSDVVNFDVEGGQVFRFVADRRF
ncbi:expressed unknown protein [Seminavis robusta]|uniref:F-box protein Hrt3/FBXO9 C-terminal domain-containing protein n=1 Tax=Seminavis robusta TaxID=568900 RepID=A0A9N8ELK2_9STRA|nr:expressed unknown protein [Seminavis robusta]|eukprot:Sro1180_g249800.1 n/a (585) ;mRNA; f:32786-34540